MLNCWDYVASCLIMADQFGQCGIKTDHVVRCGILRCPICRCHASVHRNARFRILARGPGNWIHRIMGAL